MIYLGYKDIELNDTELSEFYSNKFSPQDFELLENQYLLVRDSTGEVIDKYVAKKDQLKKFYAVPIANPLNEVLKPRNVQQECLWDMLKSECGIKLVTGRFGSGKSLAMINSAIEAVVKGKYRKLVYVRNNIEVKNTVALGSLPGTEMEKLMPFVAPLADHIGGMEGVQKLIQEEQLEVVHLGFLRGRDIRNSIIFSTEVENLTKEHLQLLIGRVGENSSLWLDGDLKQRDRAVFEDSRGIECLVDKLKGHPEFGYVHLVKSERSNISAMADLLDD